MSDNHLTGLSLLFKSEHAWLRFVDSRGNHADINLTRMAQVLGGIRGDALRQWIEDRRREAAGQSSWPADYEPRRRADGIQK